MRKLASIQKISNLLPIKDKDKIELAIINGWQVIVTKGYNIGDLIVFCEPDSVLPKKEEFKFLANRNYIIKTIKMFGIYSQGICFPLSILPENNYKIGDDVTDIIGITKYETDEKFIIKRKWYEKLFKHDTTFPSFIIKTDEERIQNIPDIVNTYNKWSATEKLDGCSATYFLKRKRKLFKKYDFGICSRNFRVNNSYYSIIALKYDIKYALKKLIKNHNTVYIQGEIIGPKIQSNKYKLKEYIFFVFNIVIDGVKLSNDSSELCATRLKLNHVPIIYSDIDLSGFTCEEVLTLAEGNSVINPNIQREGLVFRNNNNSFKAVNKKFLINYNE